jgi:hypothetical protein
MENGQKHLRKIFGAEKWTFILEHPVRRFFVELSTRKVIAIEISVNSVLMRKVTMVLQPPSSLSHLAPP